MLDERSRARSPAPGRIASTGPGPAETRDWVAEFRREQAHLIRTVPRRGPAGRRPYGIAAALAATLALAALLPGRLPEPDTATGTAVPAAPAARTAGSELAEAREEALGFDLARTRQEADAARAAHLLEVEALRAAAARAEAGREQAEAARADAESKGTALAHDLDGARADLAAAQRREADARVEAAEGRDRSEQLARQAAAAETQVQDRRAADAAALARAERERDEARISLAAATVAVPAPAATPAEPAQAPPRPVDWALFGLRPALFEASRATAGELRPPEPDRTGSRRTRGTASVGAENRTERGRRAMHGGRVRPGADRPPAAAGNRPTPDPRPRTPVPVQPDA